MLIIWKKELRSYFLTSVGYVYMAVFLGLASVFFYLGILQPHSGDVLSFLSQLSYLWMLLTPVLTMRLLAEERQKQTDQLLLTSPVSIAGIVIGKYMAAVTVMLITVILTLGYMLVIAVSGTLYPLETTVGYIGFVLEGCTFIAIDLVVTGIASNPVTASILAFGANLLLWMVDVLANAVNNGWISRILEFLSIYSKNEPFLMGQFSFASVVFDVTMIIFCLVLAMHQLDSRRYRRK